MRFLNYTEEELKQRLVTGLQNDFDLYQEMPGVHPIDKKDVIIDYLAYPHPHLTDAGFVPDWIGIEVKGVSDNKPMKRAVDLAWQAITYSQSDYLVEDKEMVRPAFILIYPSLEIIAKQPVTGLKCLLQKANVGNLDFHDWHGWRIRFAADTRYFSKKAGIVPGANIATNRRVGSSGRIYR